MKVTIKTQGSPTLIKKQRQPDNSYTSISQAEKAWDFSTATTTAEEISADRVQDWVQTDARQQPFIPGPAASPGLLAACEVSKHKHPRGSYVLSAFLMILLLAGVVWIRMHSASTPPTIPENYRPSTTDTQQLAVNSVGDGQGSIVVDIHGDVHQPGVYTLPINSRVRDAVQAAGGYVHREDAVYVNAAALLDDGVEVVIPSPIDVGTAKPAGNQVQTASGGVALGAQPQANTPTIDLNTADERTLQTIPGIGPGRAAAIAGFRREHGPFQSLQDLLNVPGIGDKTLAHLIPYVSVHPPGSSP
ncbi:hypothetical protein D2Q93_13335 [Alicyclobacillaceae bacterium I2511]|nr:hypothetical protein D2Q93_13335 [Alicyclobacillaceae bacterium I2511]